MKPTTVSHDNIGNTVTEEGNVRPGLASSQVKESTDGELAPEEGVFCFSK